MDNITDGSEIEQKHILTFYCGGGKYAFDIMSVRDIIEIPSITRLPLTADYIEGVINLRGKVIPVMNFNKRLGLSEGVYTDKSCVIVVESNGSPYGVIVERTGDASVYSSVQFAPSPVENSFISGYIVQDAERTPLIDSVRLAENE